MSDTYNDLLRASGLPRLEARLLMQQISGLSHAQLIVAGAQPVSAAISQQFQQQVERRLAGEPIAYLLGQREFYGRMFHVSPAVLIPRPETEHLVEIALQRCDCHAPINVLDLGTGSGALAVTLALEAPSWHVCASDVSAEALAVASHNAKVLQAKVDFYQGDWYQALPAQSVFDLIVSNPPYIAANDHHLSEGDLRFEPPNALTDHADGLCCYRVIIAQAHAWLHSGSWLMLEHGFEQGAAIRQLMQQAAFTRVETLSDLAGLERVTVGQLQ